MTHDDGTRRGLFGRTAPSGESVEIDATEAAPPGATPSPADPELPPASFMPARIGRYRVESLLGKGGMGEVFLGVDEGLGRRVALKRILGGHRSNPETRARFFREAQALAAIEHPGIVTIYELGETPEGDPFIAMELVAGDPLSYRLDVQWSAEGAVALGIRVAETLGAAHAAGLVHRDIKPGNLLVEPSGEVRVLDFGLARREIESEPLTKSGLVLGTPSYMSPEQVRGRRVGPPSDVFSLGVVLYRALAGAHPFVRETSLATAFAVAASDHEPLASVRPDLPAALCLAVEQCLRVEPDERFATGRELAAHLRAIAEREGLLPSGSKLAVSSSGGSATGPTTALSSSHRPPDPPGARVVAPPPAAPVPRRVSRRAWLGLSLGAVAAAAFGGVKLLSGETEGAAPAASAAGKQVDPSAWPGRPPRPVVAVLGYAADPPGPEAEGRLAVIAEALRVLLDDAPESVVSMPYSTLLGLRRGGAVPPPDTEPTSLARAGRAPGHVDAVVSGTFVGGGDRSRLVTRIVDTASGRTMLTIQAENAEKNPIGSARAIGEKLRAFLGLPGAGPVEAVTTSPEAFAAFLRGRDARHASDDGTAKRELEWALMNDPKLSLAEVEHLEVLRTARRYDDLVQRAQAMLAPGGTAPPRPRALATALMHLGQGKPRDAARELHAMLERFTYDADAHHLLMALRFNDPETVDMKQAEQLARELLAIGPGYSAAASRLVRSLAFRGKADEAAKALLQYGIPPGDNGFTIDPWAEIDLYRGNIDHALASFEASSKGAQQNVYADHMGIASLILAGRCDEASDRALDRIENEETTGKDTNLEWTYSLALESLWCGERIDAALALNERWAKRPAGAEGRLENLLRTKLLGGADAAEVSREALAGLRRLDGSSPGWEADRAQLLTILARTSRDSGVLSDWASRAGAAAANVDLSRTRQVGYRRAAKLLEARAALAAGKVDEAIRLHEKAVSPWDDIRDEGELGARIDTQVLLALALEAGGQKDRARAVWKEIAGLWYPRLWRTDAWVMAKKRAAE